MSVLRFPEWQSLCEVALLEPDPKKLVERALIAETAIFQRLQSLRGRAEHAELEAMDAMLRKLGNLVGNSRTLTNGKENVTTMPPRRPQDRLRPVESKRQPRPFA